MSSKVKLLLFQSDLHCIFIMETYIAFAQTYANLYGRPIQRFEFQMKLVKNRKKVHIPAWSKAVIWN